MQDFYTFSRFFNPKKPFFWMFSLTASSLLGTLCIFFDLNFWPVALYWLIAFSLLAFISPLWLLGGLLFIRMSLDHISQYSAISFGEHLTLSLSQLLGMYLLVMGIATCFRYRESVARFPLFPSFLLLIVYGVFSSTWSLFPLVSLQEIARLISIFSIAFLAYIAVKNFRDLRVIFLLLIASSVVPVLEAFRQWIFGIGIADSSLDVARIYGTFAHTNVLALYLYSLLVVLVLWYTLYERRMYLNRRIVVFGLYGSLSALLLFATYTRVAWIAAFLFFLVFALSRAKVLLIPLLFFPLIAFLLVPLVQERVLESFQTNPDSSLVWRADIWHDVTLKLAFDHRVLFGTGLDTFSQYAEDLRGIRFGSTDSHNDFVKFYVEGGLIGLTVFFLFLFSLARQIYSLRTLPHAYHSTIFFFSFFAFTLVLSSLTDNIYKDTPLLWIFFILFGAFLALKREIAQGEGEGNPLV
ncbi:MAG: O-antigen ligase family protein [Candidatus Moranbacteria bacterium]|jgi:O-antigen ligase|nr:O-antigen ligase family protein [Candidatus Moranbacteria bacterium]